MSMREPQPYETLKTALDEAIDAFRAKMNALTRNVNHKDGPMLLLIDIEDVFAAHAVVESRINAFAREYAHMTEVNNEVRAQRDEVNRKFESLKKTLNQFTQEDEGDKYMKGKKHKK